MSNNNRILHSFLIVYVVFVSFRSTVTERSHYRRNYNYDDTENYYEDTADGFQVRRKKLLNSVIQGDYDKEYKAMRVCVEQQTGGLYLEKEGEKCKDWVAIGQFRNAINQTGWAFLEVETSDRFPPEIQAYAAGFVEGKLSKLLIYYHLLNTVIHYCDGFESYCDRLYEYLHANMVYIRRQLADPANIQDLYWIHINLTLTQMTGISDAYNDRSLTPRVSFDISPIYMLQLGGELIDLEKFLGKGIPENEPVAGHCTGFVKIAPGNRDMFFAHVSMNVLQTMTRVVKLYKFAYDKKSVPGHTAAFSGYPGALASIDDFVLLSSGLGTTESTCAVFNKTLYSPRFMRPEGQLHCWLRSIVANRLANSGREWSRIFAQHNSGTYNNQWTIVDYKRFRKGQPLPRRDLVWLLEQYPGTVMARDVTWFVHRHGYFPSYNIPFFKKMYRLGGFVEEASKVDYWFSWARNPRAKIIRRDHHSVVDMHSLTKLMRYNDYKNDPFSRCDCNPPYTAEGSMSARGDLNPQNGTYELPGMGFRNHAGLDMKGTNVAMMKHLGLRVWGGPPYDPLPHFSWATTLVNASHHGMPTEWKFTAVDHTWNTQINVKMIG